MATRVEICIFVQDFPTARLSAFGGASYGAEACRTQPHKMPREEPHRFWLPAKVQPWTPGPKFLPLRRCLPGHIKIEISYSDVMIIARPYYDWNVLNIIWIRYSNYNMAGQKSPKRAGKKLGVWVWTFVGQFFLRGSLRSILQGWSPQALDTQEATQNESSGAFCSYFHSFILFLSDLRVDRKSTVTFDNRRRSTKSQHATTLHLVASRLMVDLRPGCHRSKKNKKLKILPGWVVTLWCAAARGS